MLTFPPLSMKIQLNVLVRAAAVLCLMAAGALVAVRLPILRPSAAARVPGPADAAPAAKPAAPAEDELEEPGLLDEAGETAEGQTIGPELLAEESPAAEAPRPVPAVGVIPDKVRLEAAVLPAVSRAMRARRIPSMAVALVSGDRIVWSGAEGNANLRVKTPASPTTVYLIASMSKTMVTMALLQQLDRGRFKLDDPVHDYLGDLRIRNESSRYPVTFRSLLTHTSGLPTDFGRHSVWEDPGPPSLEAYLAGALRLRVRPMSRVIYSNLAYTLIGYLVEKLSGVPLKQYMRENVFLPCDMRDTAFEPRPDMAERLAIPYIPTRQRGLFQPVDWVKADVWPAGIVYSTAQDMARWIMVNVNGGLYKGRRLLSEATWREMTRRQFDRFAGPINGGWLNKSTGFGLTWWVSRKDGDTVIAHSGSVMGYTGFMAGNVDRRTGVVILTNGNKAHHRLYEVALAALDALSGS